MPVGRITKRAVDAMECPEGARTFTLWDTVVKGFGVVLTVRGVRSYILQYRMGGRGSKVRRYTIGRHGSPWTADTARQRALDLLAEIRTGTDPIERERVAGAVREDEAYFEFDAFVDRFLEQHVVAGASARPGGRGVGQFGRRGTRQR